MDLSNDLISQFVKITNDNSKKKSTESTVYGTVVEDNGTKYVKIDGSDILTPVETTAEIVDGERVTVLMKNHSATVTGNISAPSASANKVNEMEGIITDVEESVSGITGNYASKEAFDALAENLAENYTNTIDMHDAIDDAIEDVEYNIGVTYATKDSVTTLQNGIAQNYVTNEALEDAIEDLVFNIETDADNMFATKSSVEAIQNDLINNYSTNEVIAETYATKEELIPILKDDIVVTELNDIPRNLNGYSVTLNLEADYEGDMVIDQFIGGTLIVNLNEYIIKGVVQCSGKRMNYIFNGPGSVQPEGELTDEMVNTFIFEDCEWSLNNVSIYSDLTNANCNAIECDHSTGDLNMVEMMGDGAFSHFIRARRSNLYLENTSGKCSDILITALDGSIISVNEESTHCETTGETVLDIRRGSLLIPDGFTFVPIEPEPEPEPEPEEPIDPEA